VRDWASVVNRPKLGFMAVCTQCGRQNADDARFCSACAAPLVSEPAAPRAVRKTVTLLFCDMVESTPLGERLDPESLRQVLARWHESMRTALERHGGTVEKFVGDAVMAVFGLPVAHEDDALRAARAAADMRVALAPINAELERDYGVQIQVRTAVHTGDVVAGNGETLVTGDAVNVAARLEQSAKPGEILLGEQTASLLGDTAIVEPVPELTLKGKTQPVAAWRLLSVLPDVPALVRPIATPFVGRRDELAKLEAAFERASAASHCEQVTVLGPPGIGKSRLLREAVGSLGTRARVVVGRCLPYGEGITYWPLAEIVREIAGHEPRPRLVELLRPDENAELAAELVADAVGASEHGARADETHWAIRMLLDALARDRPLVVVIEDLHWAEGTFLDLLEYVAGFSRGGPILLLASARPELLETRPAWATPGPNSQLVLLAPLAEPEVGALIDARLEGEALPERLRTRVFEAAEGNPLFVEQLVAFEDSTDGELVVPPTLRALLTARIDRLERGERAVIERASVEGRGFHRGAVVELLPSSERAAVGARLLALVRKELIRPDRSKFPDDDGYRFAHALIRDAAYESAPKELRAELHELYANWLAQKVGERAREYEELLGYHLEQAYRYRVELGPVDDRSRALATRGSERLATAAHSALSREDFKAAATLLRRAAALRRKQDPARLELLPEIARALASGYELAEGDAVLGGAIEEARAFGHRAVEWRARLLRAEFGFLAFPHSIPTHQLRRVAEQALDVFEELGDERGKADAWEARVLVHSTWGQFEQVEQAAPALIQNAGDAERERLGRFWLETAIILGPTPVPDGIKRCETSVALADSGIGILGRAMTMSTLAVLHAMSGDLREASELLSSAQVAGRELGVDWQFRGVGSALRYSPTSLKRPSVSFAVATKCRTKSGREAIYRLRPHSSHTCSSPSAAMRRPQSSRT
jgi:class 3 adenylate cyclase